jgi:hypothetical protein
VGVNDEATEASALGADARIETPTVCVNCGWTSEGPFCARCGQKRFYRGDLGIRHAWHHLFHELLHLDGKIFRSLKSLLLRPGELTLDFIEGRRAQHVHPIRLFIVFLFLFFLFAPVNPLMEIGGNLAQGMQGLDPNQRAQLDARLAQNGTTLDALLDRVDGRLRTIAKPLDLALVVANGVLLWMLFHKRRRYLAENMTMALHLSCFNTAIQLVIGWARLYEPARVFVSLVVLAIAIGYFILAARRVYGSGWLGSLLKYIVLAVAQIIIAMITIAVVLVAHLRDALT